jgi:nucleotide-binding universal stress UspA family protein
MSPVVAPSSQPRTEGRRAVDVVLVGLAGEPSDAPTLACGAALARAYDGELHTLHVEPDAAGVVHADQELARAGTVLDARLLVLGTRNAAGGGRTGGASWGASMPEGTARNTSGRGGPGTTTRGLLADPHHPLWLQRGPWAPPDRILAAIDVPDRDRAVLEAALDLATRLQSSLAILHCQDAGRTTCCTRDRASFERWTERLVAQAPAQPPELQVLHLAGPPVRALARHMELADLVVLGRGSRRGLGRVLHEAVATRRGPLLVVPTPA